MPRMFRDRAEAGRLLAEQVRLLGLHEPVVVALPRGGVPVAAEIARALRAPLDLAIVRKIGAPGQPELAVGAVVDGDHADVVIDRVIAQQTGADEDYLEAAIRDGLREIARRRERYLRGRPAVALAGHDVVVVDDGIATGSSMKVALRSLRRRGAARLVLAVPVAPGEVLDELAASVDTTVCLARPDFFGSVGQYYVDFPQLEDDEVVVAMNAADDALTLPAQRRP